MNPSDPPSCVVDASSFQYVVGVDIGMESCSFCVCSPEKSLLQQLGVAPDRILIGLEATSRYGENLYHALLKQRYRVCLLHPGQIHAFAQQRGLRAKTDRLDATTIARALLSGEARFGYVPSEEVAT